jgi:hypothetical protein
VYFFPARTRTVRRFAKSRTMTVPRRTDVVVELHVSFMTQTVPRTVADAWRPLVRKRP